MTFQNINDVIDAAKKKRPQYTFMLSRLFPISMPESEMITADRFMRLYYDPEMVEQWELEWLVAKVLVQIEHYYRRHSTRQCGRIKVLWTVACEIAITNSLSGEHVKMHPDTLYPSTFKFKEDLCAEEYYRELEDLCKKRKFQLEQIAKLPNSSSSSSEDFEEWEVPEDANIPTVDYLLALMQEQPESDDVEEPGAMGAGNESRKNSRNRTGKVPWRTKFFNVVGNIISTRPGTSDYSYCVPDPDLAFSNNLIMPGMVDSEIVIKVVVDTSSSMTDNRISQAYAELETMIKGLMGMGSLYVLSCDSAVHSTLEVTNPSQIDLFGGGGTDLGVGIRAAATQTPKPDMIVVITDGGTHWPTNGPEGIPVLVVLVANGRYPDWARETFKIKI